MQHRFDPNPSGTNGGSATPPACRILSDDEKDAIKERFRRGRQLVDTLPYSVPGGVTITSLECLCGACRHSIPPAHVNVQISEFPAGVVTFDCIGVCSSCRAVSKYLYRFRADGTVQTFNGHRWISMTWSRERRPWWDILGRFKAWLHPRKGSA